MVGDALEDALHSLKSRNGRLLQALSLLYEAYLPSDSSRHEGIPQPMGTEKTTAWEEPLLDPKEDVECYKQFRAQPIPAHVLLPLYNDIMEQQEERRRSHVQRRKQQLIAMQKPFRFSVEEKRGRAGKAPEEPPSPKPAQGIKPIPKSILDPTVSDRLREAELLRKINSQLRAQDLLRSSSAPVPLTRHPPPPDSRKQRRLAFLQQAPTFQPRTNPAVPNFQTLHRNLQKLSLRSQPVPEPTQTRPFTLRTSRSRDRQRPRPPEEQQEDAKRPVTSPGYVSSLSPNTLPVYITDSTKRREAAIRSSLQDREHQESSKEKWLQKHQRKSRTIQRSVSQRAKALDPHTPLTDATQRKLRELQEEASARSREYRKELEQMERRVKRRAFLFERVSKGSAVSVAERRFTRTLQQAGLTEEFVQQKGISGGDAAEEEDGAEEDAEEDCAVSDSERRFTHTVQEAGLMKEFVQQKGSADGGATEEEDGDEEDAEEA